MRAILIPALAASLFASACARAQDDAEEAPPADEAAQAEIFASDAFRHYAASFGPVCFWGEEVAAADAYPAQRWDITWESEYGDGPQTATLYKFHCDSGAYNVISVWYLQREFTAPEPLAFAEPRYDVVYENGDSDGAVLDVRVDGFTAQATLVNSEFDPAAVAISAVSFWRGVGDASSRGVWTFDDGMFVLKRYEIDGSYDGEVNPVLVVDY